MSFFVGVAVGVAVTYCALNPATVKAWVAALVEKFKKA